MAQRASQNDIRAPAARPAYTAISPSLSRTLSRTPPNFETFAYLRAIAPSTASKNPATTRTTTVAPHSQPDKPPQYKIEAKSHRKNPSTVREFGESPARWKSLEEDWKIPSTRYWIRDSITAGLRNNCRFRGLSSFYETFY